MITTRQLFNLIQTNSNLYLLPCKLDPDELARLLGDRIVQTSGKNYAIAMHRDDPTDCSDRTEYFDWHSDGLYHARPPRFVLLHCLHPGNGHCNTEFANVETLLDSISEDSLYTLRNLRSHYIGHGGCFMHPISIGREMLLASRGYVSPLPDLPLENTPSIRDITSAFSDLYQQLGQIAYSSKWQKDDTFVFDQYKTLHRRTSRGVDRGSQVAQDVVDVMDEFINVRSSVEEFLRDHPELKPHEALLLELARDVWHSVNCGWPSCTEG